MFTEVYGSLYNDILFSRIDFDKLKRSLTDYVLGFEYHLVSCNGSGNHESWGGILNPNFFEGGICLDRTKDMKRVLFRHRDEVLDIQRGALYRIRNVVLEEGLKLWRIEGANDEQEAFIRGELIS